MFLYRNAPPAPSPFNRNLLSIMSINPETDKNEISLPEAERHLFGALIRKQLREAISEAEDEREPIDPEVMRRLKRYFDYFNRKVYLWKARNLFFSIWEREKEEAVHEEIIEPLREIYTEIEGKEPDPSEPWLGKLLIDAALEKEGTEEVRSFLSQFSLDPKDLVEEVYQYLDRDLEK